MHLFDVTRSLINFGVKYILVEKPCSISLNELNILMKLSKKINPRFLLPTIGDFIILLLKLLK